MALLWVAWQIMTLIDKSSLILVTGATGAVGPRVVHALHQAGYQIRSFSFDAPTVGMFPQSVEVLIGDVTDQVAVQSAMQGVDAVVHMRRSCTLSIHHLRCVKNTSASILAEQRR